MKRHVLALMVLALFVVPATAAEERPSWKRAAWYLLGYMDGFGWLGIADGPYANERVCKIEAKRRNAIQVERDVAFECRYLREQPKPDRLGGILVD